MHTASFEQYEDLSGEFQERWIVLLRDCLRKHGIPHASAKEICGEFSFDLSMLFDQGAFERQGKTYRPVVAFVPALKKSHSTSSRECKEYRVTTERRRWSSRRALCVSRKLRGPDSKMQAPRNARPRRGASEDGGRSKHGGRSQSQNTRSDSCPRR